MRLRIRNLCLDYANALLQNDDVAPTTSSIEELPLPVDDYEVDMHADVKKGDQSYMRPFAVVLNALIANATRKQCFLRCSLFPIGMGGRRPLRNCDCRLRLLQRRSLAISPSSART